MGEANARKAQLVEVLSEAQIYRDFREAFRKATGLPFTRSPTGKTQCFGSELNQSPFCVLMAKNLLLNPNLRISEIAFEVGFQSLSQFNRSFRRGAGFSPKEYRTSNALISVG